MHVSVELPDPKTHGLDAALLRQFADIQRQLMGLVKSQQESQASMRTELMGAMRQQSQQLVDAFERLLSSVKQTVKERGHSEAMVESLKGLRTVITSLPSSLQQALDRQYASMQERPLQVSVKPQVTVTMPSRLTDAMESAMLHGSTKFRNRTFGSNW